MTEITVYRFRDKVALNLPGESQTVYLDTKQANDLAHALVEATLDVACHEFAASKFGKMTIKVEPSQ
jgi:hypothetical protein